MAKEWILNSVMNRFQLNFKKNVGATSDSIRQCAPNNIDQWRSFYFSNVRSEDHIEELGRKLHCKITEVIPREIEEITEQDCIDYMKQLVIDRTFDGYNTEITTVYGQLQDMLNISIEAAPDEWDRHYNVDFFIKIREQYIGLQIKPVNSGVQIPEIFKEYSLQEKSHKEFSRKYGGAVFYVFSTKINEKKEIVNIDVVPQIQNEINRLQKQ